MSVSATKRSARTLETTKTEDEVEDRATAEASSIVVGRSGSAIP